MKKWEVELAEAKARPTSNSFRFRMHRACLLSPYPNCVPKTQGARMEPTLGWFPELQAQSDRQ
jgi:hypothetical protein